MAKAITGRIAAAPNEIGGRYLLSKTPSKEKLRASKNQKARIATVNALTLPFERCMVFSFSSRLIDAFTVALPCKLAQMAMARAIAHRWSMGAASARGDVQEIAGFSAAQPVLLHEYDGRIF